MDPISTTLTGHLLSYLIGLAASLRSDAVNNRELKKLEGAFREKALKQDASLASKPLAQRLGQAMVEASKLRASLGLSDVESRLFDVFADAQFQSHLALWFQTSEPKLRTRAEMAMTEAMTQALRAGNAPEEHIQNICERYFQIVHSVVLKKHEIANQLILQKIDALHQRLEPQVLKNVFADALQDFFAGARRKGWDTSRFEDLGVPVEPLIMSLPNPNHDDQKNMSLSQPRIANQWNLKKIDPINKCLEPRELKNIFTGALKDAFAGARRKGWDTSRIEGLDVIVFETFMMSLLHPNHDFEKDKILNYLKEIGVSGIMYLDGFLDCLHMEFLLAATQRTDLSQFYMLGSIDSISGEVRAHTVLLTKLNQTFESIKLEMVELIKARFQRAETTAPHQPNNLPYGSLGDLFMGREDLLQTMATPGPKALTQPATLSGLGGVGKSRLAVEFAWRMKDQFSALFFVRADSEQKLFQGIAALAARHLLNLPEQDGDARVQHGAVLEWLAQNPGWLMILDNIDDLKAQSAVLALLPKLSNGRVLMTSRLSNWPPGPEILPLDVMSPEKAKAYLLKAAHRRAPLEEDEALAETLAKSLGHLPLALELAAGFMNRRRISLARYMDEWKRDGKKMLEWRHDGSSQYPKSMAIIWNHCYQQCGAAARALLRFVSFLAADPIPRDLFDDGDYLERAIALATKDGDPSSGNTDPQEALAELADYNLINSSADYFTVHPMVAQVMQSQIPKVQEPELVRICLDTVSHNLPSPADDVRSWPKWRIWEPHVRSVIEFGETQAEAGSLTYLMNAFGVYLKSLGLYDAAEPLYRKSLEIETRDNGPDHPEVAIRLNNLAQLLKSTNRLKEAEPLMREALEIDLASYGGKHPRVAIQLNNLAQLLGDTNRLKEAEPLMREALEIDLASYGEKHPKVAIRLNNLAQLLGDTNRLKEAEPLMREALEIDRGSYGEKHPDVAIDLNNLARLLQDTNRPMEAEPLMRQALGISQNSLGPDHPNTQVVATNLQILLKEIQDLEN